MTKIMKKIRVLSDMNPDQTQQSSGSTH